MSAITLNGTTFYASNIRHRRLRFGRELEASDGTFNLMLRGSKHEWEIPFDDVDATARTNLEAISALTTSFTFVDERGASYTVACPLDAYDDVVSIIKDNTTLYYNVTLKIRQV
jgi:hypothetical protein